MTIFALIKRHTKVYFKDKAVFWSSLITPLILLFLFISFLKNVYIDSLKMQIPDGVVVSERCLNGFAGSWLISSLLAVSCITIAFCANMVIVQDKQQGTYKDLIIAPIKKSTLTLSYYISTAIVTAIVCYVAFAVGLIYLAVVGFYLSIADILLVVLDIALLVLFGSSLSALVCGFVKSQGAMSAVSTLVSTGYGFICGAYMPLSQFGEGLRNVLMFFPGTYGTGLIRKHMMRGVSAEFLEYGFDNNFIHNLRKSCDAKLMFNNKEVSSLTMYLVLSFTIVVLIGLTIVVNSIKLKKSHKKTK